MLDLEDYKWRSNDRWNKVRFRHVCRSWSHSVSGVSPERRWAFTKSSPRFKEGLHSVPTVILDLPCGGSVVVRVAVSCRVIASPYHRQLLDSKPYFAMCIRPWDARCDHQDEPVFTIGGRKRYCQINKTNVNSPQTKFVKSDYALYKCHNEHFFSRKKRRNFASYSAYRYSQYEWRVSLKYDRNPIPLADKSIKMA